MRSKRDQYIFASGLLLGVAVACPIMSSWVSDKSIALVAVSLSMVCFFGSYLVEDYADTVAEPPARPGPAKGE